MINILIADDHNVFVEGIESLLTDVQGLAVVGRCCSVTDVRDTLMRQSVDVVLLDLSFPKVEDGMMVCHSISACYPSVRIIALTMHDETSIIKRALRKGAHGYLLKNTSKDELIEAILTVYDGKPFTNRSIQELIDVNDQRSRKRTNLPDPEVVLTPREKEVLFLISEGMTTQQIANKLFVTLKAVEFHRSSLLAKFDVSNTALLIKTALKENFI